MEIESYMEKAGVSYLAYTSTGHCKNWTTKFDQFLSLILSVPPDFGNLEQIYIERPLAQGGGNTEDAERLVVDRRLDAVVPGFLVAPAADVEAVAAVKVGAAALGALDQ